MNLFSLYAKIGLDTSEYDKGVKKVQGSGKTLSGTLGKGLTAAVNGVQAAAKVSVTAVGAVASGIGALSVAAINSYAEYEQLVGGVETLFKESAKTVENYADAAYQTAGMSANQYMDTVTSFSATLLQGLGNDTAKAAEYGNKAVVQMSDNANKMGTSMSAIQYAYQGFAKQNYTMLDNLKLGYGGTQAEMARLINDSGVLGDTMEVTAETVNQVSFATIIDAIGVVQDRLGITGTTAKEAASTIQGSVASMKASWSNLLTALTAEDWDVGVYVENFAESFKTVIQNVAPRIVEALPNITAALGSIFEQLAPYLSEVIQTLLPALVQGAIMLVTSLAAQLPDMLSVIADALKNTFVNIFNSMSPEVQSSLQTLFSVFQTLLPVIVGVTAAVTAFRTAMTIAAIVQGVTQAITAFKTANDAATISQALLNAAMNANPFILIVTLIAGVVAALVTLWNTNEDFRNAVINIWENIKQAFSDAWEFIKSVWDKFSPYFKAIWEPLSQVVGAFVDAVISFVMLMYESAKRYMDNIASAFKSAWEAIKVVWDAVSPYFSAIWENIQNVFSVVSDVLSGYFATAWLMIQAVWNTVTSYFETIFNTISGIFSAVTSVLRGDFESAWQAIKDVFVGWGDYFSGLLQNLLSIFGGVADIFIDVGSDIIDGIKQGIANAWDGLANWFENLWDSLFGNRSVDVDVDVNESSSDRPQGGGVASLPRGVNGSYAAGLDYVPFDGFIAELHEGEKILTAEEAKKYNAGGVTVIQNIYSQAKNAAELMQEARNQQRKAVLLGNV